MKLIAYSQRLLRDWNYKALAELDAPAKLELLDAINGGLQSLHAIAPAHSKITQGSLSLGAPTAVSLALTEGSAAFTGYTVTEEDMYCTVRLDGDAVDNQIIGTGLLLHPYAGATGTAAGTIYHDACLIPEIYDELLGKPRIIETRRDLEHYPGTVPDFTYWSERVVREPRFYVVEGNARNQNPVAPAVFRTDSLPDRAYRMNVRVKMSPLRVKLTDLASDSTDVPLREDHVELYLLPVSRGLMALSQHWSDKERVNKAFDAADAARDAYRALAPQYLSTPANSVGTPIGW